MTDLLLYRWSYKPTGEDGLSKVLSPNVRARYDRSLAVVEEAGDGMGALAWDPAGVTPNEPPNTDGDKGNPGAQPSLVNQGVWYWLHQETLDEPTLLLDDDYRPKSAEAALTNVIQRFGVDVVEHGPSELVVDTAHPRNLLQLHFERGTSIKPILWLRSYDYSYSLY